MSEKYLVTQEFMNELIKWKNDRHLGVVLNVTKELLELPVIVKYWQTKPLKMKENNNRLIAIIQWLNGEDVFETQKIYKYYIARKSYPVMYYFSMKNWYHSEFPKYDAILSEKKVFDTREEAEKWLIPGYEVVEIDENEL